MVLNSLHFLGIIGWLVSRVADDPYLKGARNRHPKAVGLVVAWSAIAFVLMLAGFWAWGLYRDAVEPEQGMEYLTLFAVMPVIIAVASLAWIGGPKGTLMLLAARRDWHAHGGERPQTESRTRHVITDEGVALRLSDDWQVLEGDLAPDAAEVGQTECAAGARVLLLAWRGEDGLKLQVEPTAHRTPEAIAADVRSEPGPSPDIDPSVEYVTLPAGRAARLRSRSESTGHAIVSTRYIVVGRARAYHLVFASPRPPEGDWLSVAETFEFMPAEE